jgi:hypothetical protein
MVDGMTKQARVRHGARRGERKLKTRVTPEMMQDVLAAFECMLQCLFRHMIETRDVERVAQSPVRRKRRSA